MSSTGLFYLPDLAQSHPASVHLHTLFIANRHTLISNHIINT
jgi:hypothetical protein